MIDAGCKADTGIKMNTREIVDQMSEILLAGSETTSGTIGYDQSPFPPRHSDSNRCLFFELARNPGVKAKLLESLEVPLNHELLGAKEIRTGSQYEYLDACIKGKSLALTLGGY